MRALFLLSVFLVLVIGLGYLMKIALWLSGIVPKTASIITVDFVHIYFGIYLLVGCAIAFLFFCWYSQFSLVFRLLALSMDCLLYLTHTMDGTVIIGYHTGTGRVSME